MNILPQGFTDATHTTKAIDPGYCYIFPGAVKPVKVVMEGSTIVDEYVNKDRSREIQVYKKVGVGVVMTPDICVYVNTELAGDYSVYTGDKAPAETPVEYEVVANPTAENIANYYIAQINGYTVTYVKASEFAEGVTYYQVKA